MPYFPDVQPGDTFRPNARLSNAVRHMINTLDGFRAGPVDGMPPSTVRVSVYNAGKEQLEQGQIVNFAAKKILDDTLYPVIKAANLDTIGILEYPVAPNKTGTCIVSGPVLVNISISGSAATDKFAVPNLENPTSFNLSDDAQKGYPVLAIDEGKALILLGVKKLETDTFKISFQVSVSEDGKKLIVGSGWLRRNGKIEQFSGKKDIEPATGTLYIKSRIEGSKWTDPEIIIGMPDENSYPIAEITVETQKNESDTTVPSDESNIQQDKPGTMAIKIEQYPVTVADIFETKPCPLIKK